LAANRLIAQSSQNDPLQLVALWNAANRALRRMTKTCGSPTDH
jgi:hypothetical protein